MRPFTKNTILFFILTQSAAFAQETMPIMLEDELNEKPTNVTSTFKGTRLINGHTIETRKKGSLDFIISHRFGKINGGSYELFGLDQATIRLGFDYAVDDKFTIGVGRSSYEKTYDGYLKYRLIHQKTKGGSPLSVTAFSSVAIKTLKDPTFNDQLSISDNMAYTFQFLFARKFSPGLSLQFMPSVVHFNALYPDQLNHDIYALGMGGRIKVSKRMSINAEYYYKFNQLANGTYNAIAIGLDIETGGHVFQLQFTNATSMIEKGFIADIRNNFFKGDIHFGFNVSRTFQVHR